MGGVFRQFLTLKAGNALAGAIKQWGVIKRMVCQQGLKIRRLRGVKMNPPLIEKQSNWRLSVATREKRAQKGVFDPKNGMAGFVGHSLAPRRGWRFAPNTNQVTVGRFAQSNVITREMKNSLDPAGR